MNILVKQTFCSARFCLCVLVLALLISPLGVISFGATNTIPWYDNFENYTNFTPLIDGTQGWFASRSGCIVQQDVKYSGLQAAKLPIDVTLSNRFSNPFTRIVKLEMCIQPQLNNDSNAPAVATNRAAQFYIDSNGYFVVCDGTNWQTMSTLAGGGNAIRITNTCFTKVQINFRYKNHTWNLKAWTNDASVTTLVASTHYVNFTDNLNTFSGFGFYNGNFTSYVDDVSVTNIDFNLLPKINAVPIDIIKSINGAPPSIINGVDFTR